MKEKSISNRLSKRFHNFQLGIYVKSNFNFFFQFIIGVDNLDSIGLVTSWDNQTKLNFWKSNSNQNDSCNSLNGTDASVFHPNVNKNETLRIFNR